MTMAPALERRQVERRAALRGSYVSAVLRELTPRDHPEGRVLALWCTGCGHAHHFQVEDPRGRRPRFTWNGDVLRPTFVGISLELLGNFVCQARVVDGQWVFADDCTHAFAGLTIDLPVFPPRH